MRLIDADEIQFRCTYHGDCRSSKDQCKQCPAYMCSYSDVDEQPTAYDVDKVVEELNEQQNDVSCIDDDMYCIGVANGLADAIDIVKRGGVK